MGARSLAEQIAEVLEHFPSFCSLVEIKTKAGGKVRFDYDRWNEEQKRFERERTGRDIVIKPRQIGFSTLELARDLKFAVVHHGVNVQVVTHDADLKEQMFLTLRDMAECLKRIGLLPRTRYSTKTELVFADTGSAVRIVESGTTDKSAKKKGRSGTIHRLHATEMAFWGAAAETWNALSAAAESAEIVIESTANGAGGLFYDMVQAALLGQGQYKCHFFAWYEHRKYRRPVSHDFDPVPMDKWEIKLRKLGCDDQQIAWWRSKFHSVEIGPDKALQEYPVDAQSCFRAAGRLCLAPDVVDAMFERVRAPLRTHEIKAKDGRRLGELLVYEEHDPRDHYVVGGDVAEGVANDGSAAIVLSRKTARTVATFSSDTIEPGDFGLAMAEIGKLYGMATLAPERNNHGHTTLRAILHEAKYPRGRVFHMEGKAGWETNQVTRPVMLDELCAAIRTGIVSTPDRGTATECKTLVINEKGKVEARGKGQKDGSKDDRVIAWAIAFAVRSKPTQELKSTNIPGF